LREERFAAVVEVEVFAAEALDFVDAARSAGALFDDDFLAAPSSEL